ncbi:uncharacterized protein LOC124134089 [Haliotis rufescens]|uniref:uncharacterized protein LOC124134089 n=1 Tax=Haliotis rufescens TaxID=6454 RepID=UPI00201F9EE0|nr:uncharacterized protein LOC124134089 [Haliotis rufescens]
MDLNNLTITIGEHNFSSSNKGMDVFSVLGPINTAWIALSNLVLTMVLLSSAHLRTQLRIQLIVCISICDMTNGVLVNAFFSHSAINKTWDLGCPFHFLLQLLGVFADVFLTSWYLVLLNATYFVVLMGFSFRKLSPLGDKVVHAVLLPLPVLLFCVVALPMIFTHLRDVKPSNSVFCPLYLENEYEVAMCFVCFFIPAISLVIFCAFFIIFRKSGTCPRETLARNVLSETTMVERPMYFVIPTVAMLIMMIPDQLVNVLFFTNSIHPPKGLGWMFMLFATMETTRGGFLPVMWLLFPDIRQAVKDKLNCRQRFNVAAAMTVTNIGYRDLQNQ